MTIDLPSSPAALRNRNPIAAVLRELLPKQGLVLEVASGSGEHVVHFARLFPHLQWQPSDPDPAARAAVAARSKVEGLRNVLEPVLLDAASEEWPKNRADALLCINMVHISPWQATVGLMQGAARLLCPGARLILYGPFLRDGIPTAPSNLAFDQSLRDRNPAWGLRRVADVAAQATANGLALDGLVEMPANNLILSFAAI